MQNIFTTDGNTIQVDDADFDKLNSRKWYIKDGRYACARIGGRIVRMHRFILNAPSGVSVDHRDGNGLNNQRSNLRLCTHKENCSSQRPQRKRKASLHKGVSLMKHAYKSKQTGEVKHTAKWRAYIVKNDKQYALGNHETEIEAARAYNDAAKQFFGPFAYLNDVEPF